MDNNEPVVPSQPQVKPKRDRRAYMREYLKKRYYDKPEETAKALQKKRERYHANKPEKPKEVVTNFDLANLQHYYHRCLLLDPAAVTKMLIELGVPEMPESMAV